MNEVTSEIRGSFTLSLGKGERVEAHVTDAGWLCPADPQFAERLDILCPVGDPPGDPAMMAFAAATKRYKLYNLEVTKPIKPYSYPPDEAY